MRNFKIKAIFTLLAICSLTVFAQQEPNFALYRYNMNMINPAYASASGEYELNLLFKKQWVDLSDSPMTEALSFAAPVSDKVGLGISILHTDVFALQETDISIDFSYKVQLSENDHVFLGLKGGGSFIDIDLLQFNNNTDPLLLNVNRFNPTLGAGAYFKGERYYLSVSTPNFLSGDRYENNNNGTAQSGSDVMHLYATGGYTFDISENVTLTPAVFARFVSGAPTTTEISAVADFHEKIEVGLAFRPDESVSPFALFKLINGFHFGYAYEHTTTDLQQEGSATHEVVARIRF